MFIWWWTHFVPLLKWLQRRKYRTVRFKSLTRVLRPLQHGGTWKTSTIEQQLLSKLAIVQPWSGSITGKQNQCEHCDHIGELPSPVWHLQRGNHHWSSARSFPSRTRTQLSSCVGCSAKRWTSGLHPTRRSFATSWWQSLQVAWRASFRKRRLWTNNEWRRWQG